MMLKNSKDALQNFLWWIKLEGFSWTYTVISSLSQVSHPGVNVHPRDKTRTLVDSKTGLISLLSLVNKAVLNPTLWFTVNERLHLERGWGQTRQKSSQLMSNSGNNKLNMCIIPIQEMQFTFVIYFTNTVIMYSSIKLEINIAKLRFCHQWRGTKMLTHYNYKLKLMQFVLIIAAHFKMWLFY